MSVNKRGKIIEYSFFTDDNAREFNDKLKEAISEFQDKGYFVEVRFSINNCSYSALVIAREQ